MPVQYQAGQEVYNPSEPDQPIAACVCELSAQLHVLLITLKLCSFIRNTVVVSAKALLWATVELLSSCLFPNNVMSTCEADSCSTAVQQEQHITVLLVQYAVSALRVSVKEDNHHTQIACKLLESLLTQAEAGAKKAIALEAMSCGKTTDHFVFRCLQ